MSRSSAGEPPLDLATCDNPQGWPVPPLPSEVWQRLPANNDGLEAAAASYYGNPNLLPVAGVQGAIRMLPHLFPAAMVAAIGPLEDEHAHAWQSAGHRLRILQNATLTRAVGAATPFVLLANPNPLTAGHQPGRCGRRRKSAQKAGRLADRRRNAGRPVPRPECRRTGRHGEKRPT